MVVRPSLRVIEVAFWQHSKAERPTVWTEGGNAISVRPKQLLKAFSPMAVTLVGRLAMTSAVRALQHWKPLTSVKPALLGHVTEASLGQ